MSPNLQWEQYLSKRRLREATYSTVCDQNDELSSEKRFFLEKKALAVIIALKNFNTAHFLQKPSHLSRISKLFDRRSKEKMCTRLW